MAKRKLKRKFRLLLYERSAARYRSKSLIIAVSMIGLWFISYSTNYLPRLVPLNRWLLAGGLVAALYWLYVSLGPRFAYARPREDHLWLQTPLYRLKISYRRIRNTRPVQIGKLYPSGSLRGKDRRLLQPFHGATAVGVDLYAWPIHPLLLRAFFGRYILAPDQLGLLLLVEDWMTFSNQLSSAVGAWQDTHRNSRHQPGIGAMDILNS